MWGMRCHQIFSKKGWLILWSVSTGHGAATCRTQLQKQAWQVEQMQGFLHIGPGGPDSPWLKRGDVVPDTGCLLYSQWCRMGFRFMFCLMRTRAEGHSHGPGVIQTWLWAQTEPSAFKLLLKVFLLSIPLHAFPFITPCFPGFLLSFTGNRETPSGLMMVEDDQTDLEVEINNKIILGLDGSSIYSEIHWSTGNVHFIWGDQTVRVQLILAT